MGMTLNEYQEISTRTMPTPYDKPALSNYTLGYICEAAEFGDMMKKHIFHQHPMTEDLRRKAMFELGDGLHYLSGCAKMLGFTLEEIGIENIEKLKRRYPNGFSAEDSLNRIE